MRTFLLRRFLQSIPILLLVPLFTFVLVELAPGSVIDAWKLDPQIPDEVIEKISEKYGLDDPWYIRYGTWLKGVATHLDFGYSVKHKREVTPVIAERLYNTFILALLSIAIEWTVAIPLGVLSATRQYTWVDKVCSTIAFLGLSIPA